MDGTYDNNMPTSYNAGGGSQPATVVDTDFVKGPKGILKAVEAVLALVSFICGVASSVFINVGGGWVAFVGMSAFIINIVWYLLYAFRIINKLPPNAPWHFIEFCYEAGYALLFFTCGIVASVAAGNHHDSAAGAAAFFTFVAMIAFGLGAYQSYVGWMGTDEGPSLFRGSTRATTASPSNFSSEPYGQMPTPNIPQQPSAAVSNPTYQVPVTGEQGKY